MRYCNESRTLFCWWVVKWPFQARCLGRVQGKTSFGVLAVLIKLTGIQGYSRGTLDWPPGGRPHWLAPHYLAPLLQLGLDKHSLLLQRAPGLKGWLILLSLDGGERESHLFIICGLHGIPN